LVATTAPETPGGRAERKRRITVPRVVVLLLVAGLPAYVFVGAPALNAAADRPPSGVAGSPTPSTSPSPSEAAEASPEPSPTMPTPPVFPQPGTVFLGVSVVSLPRDYVALDRFTAATGYAPRVVQFSRAWANDRFDAAPFDQVAARGALPMLSWEPWNPRLQTKDARELGAQPAFQLARIARGQYDTYISAYANGIKSLGYRVAIRFGHEMNGFWYPWCERSNGNRPGDYVAAYRRIHDVFRALGADNAIWVWSPNVSHPGSSPLAGLYPGDAYVDWVGLSGYYGIDGPAYVSFDGVFDSTFAQLRAFARKPVVLTETAASDEAGRKADWVADMFRSLPRHPEIIGVVWFETSKEHDWRITSSPAAVAAFATGAANARYDARWAPAAVPRIDVPTAGPPSPSPSPARGKGRR
jgi:beta-mannanase